MNRSLYLAALYIEAEIKRKNIQQHITAMRLSISIIYVRSHVNGIIVHFNVDAMFNRWQAVLHKMP